MVQVPSRCPAVGVPTNSLASRAACWWLLSETRCATTFIPGKMGKAAASALVRPRGTETLPSHSKDMLCASGIRYFRHLILCCNACARRDTSTLPEGICGKVPFQRLSASGLLSCADIWISCKRLHSTVLHCCQTRFRAKPATADQHRQLIGRCNGSSKRSLRSAAQSVGYNS